MPRVFASTVHCIAPRFSCTSIPSPTLTDVRVHDRLPPAAFRAGEGDGVAAGEDRERRDGAERGGSGAEAFAFARHVRREAQQRSVDRGQSRAHRAGARFEHAEERDAAAVEAFAARRDASRQKSEAIRRREVAKLVAVVAHARLDDVPHPPGHVIDLRADFALRPDHDLGGRGRRRRAQVGYEVADGEVGLVADRGDRRDRAGGNGAGHRLLVEGPQIFERSSAAADQHDVMHLPARQVADGDGDLARRVAALYAYRVNLHMSPSKRRPRTLARREWRRRSDW